MLRPDVIFLTYDEPLKDSYWDQCVKLIPWAQRIDGVKGFDAAHKACARAAKTERFFIIDGDNRVDKTFYSYLRTPLSRRFSKSVHSWAARNSINGLIYGNGGVKNWSRKTILQMKSHESSETPEMATDFCFGIRYIQETQSLSTAEVDQTPSQAFRAGFREGVKMTLINGLRLPLDSSEAAIEWKSKMAKSNLERLKIWCSVGTDRVNGIWGIFGARLACKMLMDTRWDHTKVNDYDWFNVFWTNEIAPQFKGFQKSCSLSQYEWNYRLIKDACISLEETINKKMDLGIKLLETEDSQFFKSVYFNRPRKRVLDGTIYRALTNR